MAGDDGRYSAMDLGRFVRKEWLLQSLTFFFFKGLQKNQSLKPGHEIVGEDFSSARGFLLSTDCFTLKPKECISSLRKSPVQNKSLFCTFLLPERRRAPSEQPLKDTGKEKRAK